MSVRRLADDQPATFEFTPENRRWVDAQIAKYPEGRQASAVIPLLWQAQKQNDYWLPKPAMEKVADILGMPYIRVLEIATFYTMFNLAPVGRYFVQMCGTTPCMLRGSDDIKAVLQRRIGAERKVSADGAFSWLEVECLGACCNAPMVQINDDYYEDLTPENFEKLLDDLAAGRPVRVGSQTGRVTSEPAGGLTSLTSLYGVDGRSGPGCAGAPSAPDHAAASAERAAQQGVESEPAQAGLELSKKEGQGRPEGSIVETGVSRTEVPAAEGSAETAELEALSLHHEQEIAAKLAALPKDATPEQKGDAVGTRPVGLAAARAAAPDDLKLVKGIGPVNERKLHELGIYHFDQIAGWSTAEIRWIGAYLAFPGRIFREDWVGQAKRLAASATNDVK